MRRRLDRVAGHGVVLVDELDAEVDELRPQTRTGRGRARPTRAGRGSRASLASRASDCSSAQAASSRPTATTPSSSAQITSPGAIVTPPIATGHVDRTRRRLDRALARHVPAPHREAHRPQIARVADAGIDHQAAHAPRHQRRRQQVAEHPVRRRRGVDDDEDVAGLADLDRGVDHEVVAGVARARSPPSRPPCTSCWIGRMSGAEEAAPTDRFVHRRGADRGELDRRCRAAARSIVRTTTCRFRAFGFRASSVRTASAPASSRGNTRRTLPSKTCSFAASSSDEWSM